MNQPIHTLNAIEQQGVYNLVKLTQQKLGIGRIKLGALLCLMQSDRSHVGKSGGSSFTQFLLEEGIEPRAAAQYMKVAKKFLHELRIDTEQLALIASASMRALTLASEIVTEENLAEVIAMLHTLPRTEVIANLNELKRQQNPANEGKHIQSKRPVTHIINQIHELTLEDRQQLMVKLRVETPVAQKQHQYGFV